MKALPIILVAAAGLLNSCSEKVSGGTTEETNAVAGLVWDASGNPVAGALVDVRSLEDTSSMTALAKSAGTVVLVPAGWYDTTDADGAYLIEGMPDGMYAVQIRSGDSLSALHVMRVDGVVHVGIDTVRHSHDVTLQIALPFGDPAGSVVSLPGTDIVKTADSTGTVTLSGVPEGIVPLQVRAADADRYADCSWLLKVGAQSELRVTQPIPSTLWMSALASGTSKYLLWRPMPDSLRLALDRNYGVRGEWSFDYLDQSVLPAHFFDSRGFNEPASFYGGVWVDGVKGKALRFASDDDFAVIEDDGRLLLGISEFSVEAWVRVDSLPHDSGRWNLFGKLGFDSLGIGSVFSLAISDDDCELRGARVAFFLADSTTGYMNCKSGVFAADSLQVGAWHHVVAVYADNLAQLYLDGKLAGERRLSANLHPELSEPVFFGKSGVRATVDWIRVLGYGATEADAAWRWSAVVLDTLEEP